jgi:hypothetical protein
MKESFIDLIVRDSGLSRMEVQKSITELINTGWAIEKDGVLIPAINGIPVNE